MTQVPPIIIFLATLAILAFVASAASFLLLVWRLSWSLQGYVATELQRSKYEGRVRSGPVGWLTPVRYRGS